MLTFWLICFAIFFCIFGKICVKFSNEPKNLLAFCLIWRLSSLISKCQLNGGKCVCLCVVCTSQWSVGDWTLLVRRKNRFSPPFECFGAEIAPFGAQSTHLARVSHVFGALLGDTQMALVVWPRLLGRYFCLSHVLDILPRFKHLSTLLALKSVGCKVRKWKLF